MAQRRRLTHSGVGLKFGLAWILVRGACCTTSATWRVVSVVLRFIGCFPRARALRGRCSAVDASALDSVSSSLARDARSSSRVSVEFLALNVSSLPLSMVKSRRASKRERFLIKSPMKRRFSGKRELQTTPQEQPHGGQTPAASHSPACWHSKMALIASSTGRSKVWLVSFASRKAGVEKRPKMSSSFELVARCRFCSSGEMLLMMTSIAGYSDSRAVLPLVIRA